MKSSDRSEKSLRAVGENPAAAWRKISERSEEILSSEAKGVSLGMDHTRIYRGLTIRTKVVRLPMQAYLEGYWDGPKFLGCCAACPRYGQTWSCPPFDYDVRSLLEGYEEVLVGCAQVVLPGDLTDRDMTPEEVCAESYRIIVEARAPLDAWLKRLEEEVPGSRAFVAGYCLLCGSRPCTRSEGRPCRYPEQMRSSLESYGFDLSRSAEELLGVPMVWGSRHRLPPYFTLVFGLAVMESGSAYVLPPCV